MKKLLLSISLSMGLCVVPAAEAGFGKRVSEILTNAQEISQTIAEHVVDVISPVIEEPAAYVGGAGLIASTIAGVGAMLTYGAYLQKDIASAVMANQITLGSLGKSVLGLGFIGTGICSIIAAKTLYDNHK